MRYLALLLLAPWLLILGWAYASYPKSLPRTPTRRLFDVLALLLAFAAATYAGLLGFDAVQPSVPDEAGRRASGAIWQQVLPALCGYGAFTTVLVLALLLRAWLWRRRGFSPSG
ncbi:hypothetical protein B0E52_07110 [Rhodanobacter sp. C06]|uniref:hypothetical protein n=1 Tax=Rhodanobacter sp. C06 TaxID=1945854 RepID=UPI000986D7AB|nr:hypothetical protein [Rhodanobacter sp. C06]OOG44506.1 hypothetical protein B0E52_07110 [Rhodanobacter sp. C06]